MSTDKIVVEVLSLDSAQCPACTYMVDILTGLPAEVKEQLDYKEWSIKTPEGIEVFQRRGGKVLPTLCIAGEPRWESVIPTLDELYGALIDAAKTEEQREIFRRGLEESNAEYE